MSIRWWNISEALKSARSLQENINELTEGEVIAALKLESGSNRRTAIIDRLISRAARMNELRYVAKLKEKYHGTCTIESPVGIGTKSEES